jgi:signal transduction histidine kinase
MKRVFVYHLLTLTLISIITVNYGCTGNKMAELKADQADSLLFEIGSHQNYERLRFVADSLEQTGDISPILSNRWKGVSYYREGNNRMAEIFYRKAVNGEVKTEQEQLSYNKSARRLSEILLHKGDYEGSLRIAIPAIEKMEQTGVGSDIDYAILLNTIGCCQLNLGRDDEANESFLTAREHYSNRWMSDSIGRGVQEAIVGTIYTSMAYINTHRYAESIYWIDRTEMIVNKAKQLPKIEEEFSQLFEDYQAHIYIMRAEAMQALGQVEEAEEAYQQFSKSQYANTKAGRLDANNYLIATKQYQTAADNYRFLNQALTDWGVEPTLDNIQTYMLPKYRANMLAERYDSANVTAAQIMSLLDSAITIQKNSATAELATIYDTNQKDAQIAQQQVDIQRTHWFTTLGVFLLLTIFFIIYTIIRRNAQNHLTAANLKLEESNAKLSALNTQLSTLNSQLIAANERAEESSKMKTNFIQQISHEIRTPLNILSGFTQIITTPGMELDDDTRNDINHQINENTNRITGLVNKMLELSDTTSKSVIERNDDVPAVQIAAQAAEDSGINNAENVTFDLQIAPEAEAAMLHTNLQQATRALGLLLDNAIKFLSKPNAPSSEGTVRLIVSQNSQDQVCFTVEDTGIGIPPEEAEHIFEEFVQLDDYYDGTGIGLTVARSIARRLDGDIVLDTTYSPGARFIFTLPLLTPTSTL